MQSCGVPPWSIPLVINVIHQRYSDAKIVFVARSEESSPKVSFAIKQAKASYVRSAFDTNEELADAIREKLGGTATVFIGSKAWQTVRVRSRESIMGLMSVSKRLDFRPRSRTALMQQLMADVLF